MYVRMYVCITVVLLCTASVQDEASHTDHRVAGRGPSPCLAVTGSLHPTTRATTAGIIKREKTASFNSP